MNLVGAMRDDKPKPVIVTQLTPKPKIAGLRLRGSAPLLLMALSLLVAQYWIAAVAAVLGGLIGFAGNWFNSRREHAAWLRDQRASRYQELVARANELQMINISAYREIVSKAELPVRVSLVQHFLNEDRGTGSAAQDYATAVKAVLDAVSSVAVIGPERVAAAAQVLQDALLSETTAGAGAVHDAEKAFLAAARDALGTR